MLSKNFDLRAKLFRLGILILGCFVTSACGSTGYDVSYVSRDEVKYDLAFVQQQPRYTEKKPMSLGALRMVSKNAKQGELGTVFMLQRKKSVYMAETKIMDTGKKRAFLSLGLDYKTRTPRAGFRMEF